MEHALESLSSLKQSNQKHRCAEISFRVIPSVMCSTKKRCITFVRRHQREIHVNGGHPNGSAEPSLLVTVILPKRRRALRTTLIYGRNCPVDNTLFAEARACLVSSEDPLDLYGGRLSLAIGLQDASASFRAKPALEPAVHPLDRCGSRKTDHNANSCDVLA